MTILDRLRRLWPGSHRAAPAPEADPAVQMLRDRFERMVEISADAIISVDHDHRIILFNRGAEEIFGYGRDEVKGKPLDMLVPGRFRAHHDAHIRAFGDGGQTARRMGERREIAGLRKGDIEFPAEASISRMDSPTGPIYTVVLRDVTDRKKAEDTQRFLAEASAVLAGSLDYGTTLTRLTRLALPHLADWCVLDVLRDGRLYRVEAAHADPALDPLARRLLDYPPDSALPHPSNAVVETGEPEWIEDVTDAFLGAIAIDTDHLAILRDLGPRSILAVPLVARGRTLGALALFSADPRRAFGPEERLLALELGRRAALAVDNARLYREAREALGARDEVLGVVSHDLGNPLSAIRVSTRVLGRLLAAGDRDGAEAQLDGVRRSALQMERLIRDLLEVRRIEAGRLRLVKRAEAIAELVAEAARAMRDVAAEQDITLRTRLEPGLPETIRVDADRVQQAFSNLLGNALRFSPPGSAVTISASPAGDAVAFAVDDMGPGLAAEDLPHVFDRFWQASQQGSHGLGLGLAIVKGIAEAHGGAVDVTIREEGGSRFSFTVPCADPG